MGMAAGQARLLSITARLSDNEQKGQSLSFAKQRLADEADQINREYNEALNATKLTVLTGFNGAEAQYTDISYGLLTEYNKLAGGKQYLVTDQKGRILVTDEIANAYKAGNGDFNVFLNKFNLTQTDIDFASTSITDDDKYQAVHDAWDKYLTSVGLGFEDLEHDVGNADIKFGWSNNAPVFKSHRAPEMEILTGTFTNKDADGNAIIEDLPLGSSYTMYQAVQIKNNTFTPYLDNSSNVPWYIFEAENNEGKEKLCLVYKNVSGPDGEYFLWMKDKDSSAYWKDTSLRPSEANDSIKIEGTTNANGYLISASKYATVRQFPLNFDGTTKEQRELYDYAVALTKSYAGKDGNDVKSIADNPENAAKIQYYKNIFNEMQQFGYVTEADMKINTNVTKLGMKDSNWFEQQLRQGKLLLKTYDASKGGFVSTTYAEDSNIQEVEDDRRIAKAEIDYTQAQEALERKDKKIDLSLKQLDTEHNALQTEYESVKSVVDKNVEKSFNIFS